MTTDTKTQWRIEFDRKALLDVLQMVVPVAEPTSPYLRNRHIEIDVIDGTVRLGACGRGQNIVVVVEDANCEGKGTSLVLANKLLNIVKASHFKTIDMQSQDDDVVIEVPNGKYVLRGLSPEGEPHTAFDMWPPGFCSFTLSSAGLAWMLAGVIYATAKENSRYAMAGVLLKYSQALVEAVATDGRRLALTSWAFDDLQEEDKDASCMIPEIAARHILSIANNHLGEVKISIDDDVVWFRFQEDGGPEIHLLAWQLDGTFPPYQDVIPQGGKMVVEFEVAAMLDALRKASIFTTKDGPSRGVRMSYFANNGSPTLTIRSVEPESGEAEVSAQLLRYSGDNLEIGINPAMLIQALKFLEGQAVEKAKIEMNAHSKPLLLTEVGNNFAYVQMPMALES